MQDGTMEGDGKMPNYFSLIVGNSLLSRSMNNAGSALRTAIYSLYMLSVRIHGEIRSVKYITAKIN